MDNTTFVFFVLALLAVVLMAGSQPRATKPGSLEEEVNSVCNHISKEGNEELREAEEGSSYEPPTECHGMDCSEEHESRSGWLNDVLNLTSEILVEKKLENDSGEPQKSFFIPSFQLFHCAVVSLNRLKRLDKEGSKSNSSRFKKPLSKLCNLRMYNRCCIKKLEIVKLKHYLNVPTCQKILDHLYLPAYEAHLTANEKADRLKMMKDWAPGLQGGYRAFVKSLLYDELVRAELFLTRYRLQFPD